MAEEMIVPDRVREATARLEKVYSLRIPEDSINYACGLAERYLCRDGVGKLEEMVIDVLDKVCKRLRDELHSIAMEKELERHKYVLLRILVEYNEISREKDLFFREWLDQLVMELKDALDKFVGFLNTLLSAFVPRPLTSERLHEEIDRLKRLHEGLVSGLLQAERNKDSSQFVMAVTAVGRLLEELDATMSQQFERETTVGHRHISEAVCSLTGIPVSWLQINFSRRIIHLEEQLTRTVPGQDHVIKSLTAALLRHMIGDSSSSRPVGSFLILGHAGIGRKALAKAIAKHLYNDENQLIRVNMSEYMDSDSASRLIGFSRRSIHGQDSISGRLSEAVRSKPYSVVLLEKIEKAHSSIIETLLTVLNRGTLTDGEGNVVDFTNTLIIMTSNIGEQHHFLRCTCFARNEKLREIWGYNRTKFLQFHKCELNRSVGERIREEAVRFFKPEVLEPLDGILVLDGRVPFDSILRLLLRDWACAIADKGYKGLVIYPSDAAVAQIMLNPEVYSNLVLNARKGLKKWLNENMAAKLLKVLDERENVENNIIYIDTLVGTNEFSFRVEKSESIVERWLFMHSKVSLDWIWLCYQEEVRKMKEILDLKRSHTYLMAGLEGLLIPDNFLSASKTIDAFGTCVERLQNTTWYNFFQVPRKCCKSSLRRKQSVKVETEALRGRLQDIVVRQQPAFGIIAGSVLEALDTSLDLQICSSPRAFLFLGLTKLDKMELIRGLSKHLATDEKENLMLPIKFSEFSDPYFLPFDLHLGKASMILKAVRKRPCSVLMFDQVEEADARSYSTLLQILNSGMLTDSKGREIDFRSTTVIFTSDLGDNNFITKLFGHSCSVDQQKCVQQGAPRFRFELLNRMKGVVFFNPLSHEQLRDPALLPMKEGCHLSRGIGLKVFFSYLFGGNLGFGQSPCAPDIHRESMAVNDIRGALVMLNA